MKEWIKIHKDTVHDMRFAAVARRCGVSKNEIIGGWLQIMCLASQSPVPGVLLFTQELPLAEEDIAEIVGSVEVARALIDAGFLVKENEIYFVLGWNKTNPPTKKRQKPAVSRETEKIDTAVYREFIDAYCNEMGVKETQIELQKAVDAFDMMIREHVTPSDMKAAIRRLKEKNYTIASPMSLVKTSIGMLRERAQEPVFEGYIANDGGNGNGSKPDRE